MLEDFGVKSRTVRVWDDVASAPKERIEDRRGIAGDVFVIKIGGAATGAGLDLDESYRVTAKAGQYFQYRRCAFRRAIPGESKPSFTLPDDEIEFGMGVHGEPGIKRIKLLPANEIVDVLLEKLIEDSAIKKGDRMYSRKRT